LSRPPAERGFLSRVAGGDAGCPGLGRAAVLLARVHCPDADPDRVDLFIEETAFRVLHLAPGFPDDAPGRARSLGAVLAGARGLRGDRKEYDDPRNSCLECVLDRRRGLPLSLSLLWMETGRRLGWRVEGVGLPGHFVVRVRGPSGGGILVDPFHGGRPLPRTRLRALLRHAHGGVGPFPPDALDEASPREILLRLCRNLRAAFHRRGDAARGLAVAEDMLLLAPGLPEALRDRGILLWEAGDRRRGAADLRGFLDAAPTAPGAEEIRRLLAIHAGAAESRN
jgi:regulator of sirC expression with transglutaminase-like and TPR domain